MGRKEWKKLLYDRRSRKYAKRKHKKKIRRNSFRKKVVENNKNVNENIYESVVTKTYTSPEVFSLIYNTDETIEYFNQISSGILRKIPKMRFLIDSSKVARVTVDALIYLIALMENMKLNKSMGYIFSGNWPENKEAETVYKESGFIDYVKSKTKNFLRNKAKVRIRSGTRNDPMMAREICDFVISELGVEIKGILFIQKILVELMSNSFYHAYPDKEKKEMNSKWYIYAEHVGDVIRIIFADTGKGISGTVRRKNSEKIKELIIGLKDEDLLYYAFQPGNFIRTETNESHRGNGLPGIKAIVEDSPINSFWVFSGKGGIQIHDTNGQKQLTKRSFLHKMYGTIYVFEFSERGMNK